jgi:hypothetical protein
LGNRYLDKELACSDARLAENIKSDEDKALSLQHLSDSERKDKDSN